MFRHLRRTLLVALSFAVMALTVMAIGVSSASPVTAARPVPTPTLRLDSSFIMSLDEDGRFHTDPSYLIRGGAAGPTYLLFEYYGTAFWGSNRLGVISVNGFQGNVTLQVLNLPAGVTSEIPTSIFVPIFGSARIPVQLRASTSAVLGNVSGVTLRGTSGALIRSVVLPTFTVVDQLPPLP